VLLHAVLARSWRRSSHSDAVQLLLLVVMAEEVAVLLLCLLHTVKQ
jgi:hypothetical protein